MTLLARFFPHLYKWLPLIEGLIAIGAVYAAVGMRIGLEPSNVEHHIGSTPAEALVFAAVLVVSITIVGLYNNRLRIGFEGELVRLALGFVLALVLLSVLYYSVTPLFLGRGILALALVISFICIALLRAAANRAWRKEDWKRNVVVLGAGRRAAWLAGLRRRTDLIGLRVVGFVPFAGDEICVPTERIIEPHPTLAEWAANNNIIEVVVAPDERRRNLNTEELRTCRAYGITVCDLLAFYERETGQVCLDDSISSWLIYSNGMPAPIMGDRVKRLFDVLASVLVAVLTGPIVALAALAIWIESGYQGPILYRQRRVGASGQPFDMFKLRSMKINAEAEGCAQWASANDARITRTGQVLRRFRIDELPQIYNVLRGEMSFVGPRPERPEFVDRLVERSAVYADRHRVKPGLTGWAQIRYSYGASESEALSKLQYDLYYVKNRSLYLDLVILLHTAEVVLWGRGVR